MVEAKGKEQALVSLGIGIGQHPRQLQGRYLGLPTPSLIHFQSLRSG